MARAVVDAGGTADEAPLADGGEGNLEALGGANRTTTVSGPLGDPVEAVWRLDRRAAVIEMARASGLDVVGGPEGNDAVAASTYGTGELMAAAVERGAREIVVAVGGSATTDGGLGALRALEPSQRLRGIEIRVACDVRLPFVDAAEVYGPQKWAGPAQVELLRRRLERLAQIYEEEYGVDVTGLAGAGAAGGLAGGLAAIGAHLEPGFDLVADAIDLDERMEGCDLVVTGEGFLDEQSFDGKVVGGVAALAAALCVPVLVVAGDVMDPLPQAVEAVSLTERFGGERSRLDALACIEAVVADHLASS